MKLGWTKPQDLSRRQRSAVLFAGLLAVALVVVAVMSRNASSDHFRTARLATIDIPGSCDGGATEPFTPSTVDIQDVGQGLPVQPIARERDDIPGVPPVSATHTVAFDAPGPQPGAEQGLVRLNAHTWPNGAALGNAMLAKFDVGDILTLRRGDLKVCYRVTERVEVDGDKTYEPFYALDGPSQFAFIVCSGERRGPGDWSMRTIWFGKPIGDVRAKPTLETLG